MFIAQIRGSVSIYHPLWVLTSCLFFLWAVQIEVRWSTYVKHTLEACPEAHILNMLLIAWGFTPNEACLRSIPQGQTSWLRNLN